MTLSIRILSVVGLFALSACAREGTVPEGPPTQTTRSVSRADRLATIGIAQALLHEADVLEGLGQRGEATLRAERVLSLELADGRLDDADAAIERGLAEVHARSYFEARLHLVRGRVLEARAAAHREAGREDEAQVALRAALEAHERSISINEALLRAEAGTP